MASITIPLREPLFRKIWFASLLSNLGLMMLSVGAAWAMTLMHARADMIALVQTALMAPMLFSIATGAIADMYDRRKVGIIALVLSLVSAALLTAATYVGFLSPWLLLGFCFLIGMGMTLFNPAWQASVSEQVPAGVLPEAIALNSVSFNIARSVGPALGGMVVAAAGALAAFGLNALFYLPLLITYILWRRQATPSRLPPERIDRAVSAGVRYVIHSPAIRTVVLRTVAFTGAGSSISALMPIVTRDLLGGGVQTYGLILGAFGVGAVLGALCMGFVRRHMDGETGMFVSAAVMGSMVIVVSLSHYVLLTVLALVAAGVGWMIAVTLCNVAIQMSAPRWVSGRVLASFQTAVAIGVAFGSWIWGHVTNEYGISFALLTSGAMVLATGFLGMGFRMPVVEETDRDSVAIDDPEVALRITPRSGPIVIEILYRVPRDQARQFYNQMLQLSRIRQRNGAYGWSIARDISEPELWTERYECPTWLDYLRLRNRSTPSEVELHRQVMNYQATDVPLSVRRMLERPFGSVRLADNSPDQGV